MARPNRPYRHGPTRPKQRQVLIGTLHVNTYGKGTVETPEGVYDVTGPSLDMAMNGDTVQVKPLGGHARGGQRPQGTISHVLDRAVTTFAGRFEHVGPFEVLVPLDERILQDFVIEAKDSCVSRLGVRDDDIVAGRILRYPTRNMSGVATIDRVIGDEEDARIAIEAIIASHDLAVEFGPECLEQARSCRLDIESALNEPGRRDIRHRFVVTVDPDDARDFDDAVSLERLAGGGWLLGVHIADVSAYVPWESPIDLEARRRGTSVYLADRVLPMLPPELSNDLCSLRPNEDRLAVTVDMTIEPRGRITGVEMYPSVVRSSARMRYGEVDALLDAAAGKPGSDPALLGVEVADVNLASFFQELDTISGLRRKLRRERGSIEFISSEAKVVLDEDGRPVGVSVRRPTPATMLIEEAMLAANECVARRLETAGVPAVYRVHESPSAEELAALAPLLQELDCLDGPTKAGLLMCDSHAVQAVLDAAAGKPCAELVSSMLLRAMRRAVYAPTDDGHYGLGARSYCHFTSPIRRYPDLVVHRSLKSLVAGTRKAVDRKELEDCLPYICKQSSRTERSAAAAAYESQSVKLAEYMEQFIGQTFEGVIQSVQPFGLFVRIVETSAEGLLHARDLGDGWWDFNEERRELTSEKGDRAYRIGQTVEVKIKSCDSFRGRIELGL